LDLYKSRRLADLLRALSKVEGIEWIRLHYAFPTGFPEDVLEVIRTNHKVCNYIDIPLQHISDSVLKSMRRGTTHEKTDALLRKFRQEVPGIAIRTSLIVGFPGETEEDFQLTLDLLKETRPSVCNRTRFVPRDGTVAAKMVDVPGAIKKDRSRRITEFFKTIVLENNQEWVGWEGRVIIDEFGKEEGTMMGRNEFYKPIVVPGKYSFGDSVQVKVTAADTFCLLSEVQPTK
jgi:ribosomal protein S12 methylthiotransferase